MERIFRNLEFKENRGSRTRRLWEDFCRSEKSDTTLADSISISSKPVHSILKNKTSNESIRNLSETDIDTLISRANEHQSRLFEEVQMIKKCLDPPQPEIILESEPTAGNESGYNLNIGSITARSTSSAKSENLSEYNFSHRSSNHEPSNDIHVYKLVIGNSNSSICEDRSNQSTARSVPTPRIVRPNQQKPVKTTKKSPSKYNLLSAKEHLEMQRILGIENLLKRGSKIEKPRLGSPDLEQIESGLNMSVIDNVS